MNTWTVTDRQGRTREVGSTHEMLAVIQDTDWAEIERHVRGPANDNADSTIAGGGGIGDWLENQPDNSEPWWIRRRDGIATAVAYAVLLAVAVGASATAWLLVRDIAP